MKEETKDMGNNFNRLAPNYNRGKKNSGKKIEISKMHFCIGFLGVMLLAINIFSQKKVSKKEIADLNQFSEYYSQSFEENGGFEVSDDLFYTFKRSYNFKKKSTEETGSTELASAEVTNGDGITVTVTDTPTTEIKVVEYIVKRNDTFDSIAKAHNTKAEYIKIMNQKGNSNKLKEGEKLTVVTENAFVHKIVAGDSLGKIATKYKVNRSEIEKINKVDPKRLKLGSTIYIRDPNLSQMAISAKKEKERNEMKKPKGDRLATKGNKAPTKIDPKESKIAQITPPRDSGGKGFRYPVATRKISSKYGNRFHPVLKRYVMHTGIDLAARYAPLTASRGGTVSYTGYMGGYGKIIIIKHPDGYETRYAHLQSIKVRNGATVKAGQSIGTTGRTGRVTGPHLHFEIRKNGSPRNPVSYLR